VERTEETKEYENFKKLITLNKEDEDNKDTSREIISLVDSNLRDVIKGFVYTRLIKNIKNEQNKHHEPISFFVYDYDINRALADSSLVIRTKDKISEKINEIIPLIPVLTEDNFSDHTVFRAEVLFDTYSNTQRNYIYYFNIEDKWICDSYTNIYKQQLLQDLGHLYFNPNVNRQINTERFQLCSAENFKEENGLLETSFQNIEKLITRLIAGVKEGRKIIADENIILCYKTQIVQEIIKLSQSFLKSEKKHSYSKPEEKNIIQESEDAARKTIIQILKGSVKQEEYAGFFTKDDYIKWVIKKHPTIPKERIESIFQSVTWPRPPAGVTRFIVPATKDHEELIYFISLEHVPSIYNELEFRHSKFKVLSQITEKHFIFFIKKLFKDFTTMGYNDNKIASILNCSPSLVESMKKFIIKCS